MDPGLTVLSTALLAYVFAFMAVNISGEDHGAVLKFTNTILAYFMILMSGYLALQVANHTYLGSGVLTGFTNMYSLLAVFLFMWLVWHYYWNLVGDPERRRED